MPAEDGRELQMGKAGFQPLLELNTVKELLEDGYSGRSRPPIPIESGHRFRSIPATDSDARRPPRLDPFTELTATLVKPSNSR